MEAAIQKFDVVLIDEIQDYQQEWIDIIIKYFTHSETELVVFGDEKQNIYDRQLDENNEPIVRRIPAQWNKSLNTSHRFSSNIGNIAKKFQKLIFKQKYTADDVNVMSSLDFEKKVVEYHYFNSYNPNKLVQSIYSVLKTNEIHSSDADILYSKAGLLRAIDFMIRTTKHEKTAITFESQEEFDKIRDDGTKKLLADGIAPEDVNLLINKAMRDQLEAIRKIRKNHFWMKTGTVKLSTIHSFKGWEIDTLFLFIEPNESANAEVIYTGLTRAKRNLIIFNLGNIQYDEFFRNEIDTVYNID